MKNIDKKYYINVNEKMKSFHLSKYNILKPKCNLPKPKLKQKVVFDNIDGFLPIISIETEK